MTAYVPSSGRWIPALLAGAAGLAAGLVRQRQGTQAPRGEELAPAPASPVRAIVTQEPVPVALDVRGLAADRAGKPVDKEQAFRADSGVPLEERLRAVALLA